MNWPEINTGVPELKTPSIADQLSTASESAPQSSNLVQRAPMDNTEAPVALTARSRASEFAFAGRAEPLQALKG
jgi:hypothetical protein